MKVNSLSYTPPLGLTSKGAIWILLILCEVAIGLTVVTLRPLHILILVLGTSCVIYSFERPYFAYALLLFSLPFSAYNIMGAQGVKDQLDLKFSDVAIILAVFCWLGNGLIKKNLSFEKSPILLPLFLLFTWMFFSLSWCYSFSAGSFEFAKKLVSLAVFFLTINLVTDRKRLDMTFKLWTICGLIFAFCGLWEVFHEGFGAAETRSPGQWGDAMRTSAYTPGPNKLGFFLNICLMISIPQLVTTKSFRYKIFLIFSIVMMMVILITTMSRGSWAGFIAGAVILSFYSKGCRRALIIGLFAAIVFFIAISTTNFMGAVYERFAGLVNPTITRDYYGKSSVWSAGLQMFQESPIRGVGIGSYKLLSPVYGSTMLAYAHNLYVLILTEFGLIGVALFLFLVAAYFSEAIKVLKRLTDKAEKLIFVGLITGLLIYCIQGMTISFSFREADMWAFFGLSIAAIRIFGTQQPATQTETISVTN